MGRACRTSKDKPFGYAMIPVHGRFEEAGEVADGLDEGAFGTVLNVLRAFLEQVRGGRGGVL